MTKIADLTRYLTANNIDYQVIEHDPAFSAHDVAVATHVADKVLAKVILVRIDERYWITVLRADQRVDTNAIKKAFGAKQVHFAHEEDLEILFPDCQIGAMPPFGNLYGVPVLVEEALTEDEEIVFTACTHTKAIRMKFQDFKRLAGPLIARFAETSRPREDWGG